MNDEAAPTPAEAPAPPALGRRAVLELAALALAAALVAWPMVLPPARDDFPFSPYLMFADKKDETTTVVQAVAVLGDGREVVLPPRFLGTDEVLQARALLVQARKDGKRAQTELCWKLAEGVRGEPDLAAATSVELRTVTFNSLTYFREDAPKPERKTIHARCAVKR